MTPSIQKHIFERQNFYRRKREFYDQLQSSSHKNADEASSTGRYQIDQAVEIVSFKVEQLSPRSRESSEDRSDLIQADLPKQLQQSKGLQKSLMRKLRIQNRTTLTHNSDKTSINDLDLSRHVFSEPHGD